MDKISDGWRTPDDLYQELNREFDFQIDLCATKENSKCDIWYQDYLKDVQIEKVYLSPRVVSMQEYREIGNANYVCFMNPPYSNPKPFIEKAWEDSKHCKIVCLVRCDPSTKWWSTFWDYNKETEIPSKKKCPWCNGNGSYYLQDCPSMYVSPCEMCANGNLSWQQLDKILYNGPKPGCEVRFFPKRIKFDPSEGLSGKSGPTFPCALVIMDRRNV